MNVGSLRDSLALVNAVCGDASRLRQDWQKERLVDDIAVESFRLVGNRLLDHSAQLTAYMPIIETVVNARARSGDTEPVRYMNHSYRCWLEAAVSIVEAKAKCIKESVALDTDPANTVDLQAAWLYVAMKIGDRIELDHIMAGVLLELKLLRHPPEFLTSEALRHWWMQRAPRSCPPSKGHFDRLLAGVTRKKIGNKSVWNVQEAIQRINSMTDWEFIGAE